MSFGIGLLFYVLGTALIALCLFAVSGPHSAGQVDGDASHGHGASH